MIFTISILDGIKYINLSFRITFGKLITPVIRLIQKSKEIEMKTLFIVTLLIAGMLTTYTQACTRVVYLGKNGMIVTGRTMDWKEDLKSNIYVFPRGIERAGADKGNTIHWKSKYGSVITAGYDIGTSDGMNEKDWWPTSYT